MILRVLPIHVPPCYEGGYLKPTALKPYITYDDHHSTSIIRRQCKDKGHSSHPQGKPQSTSTGGGGGKYITLGGVTGPAKPGSYGIPFHAETKSLLHLTWQEVWWSLGSYPSMFHHAMREEYLKPTPLKPYMTYADHLVWPIHVPRRCEPLITPHLSLWGNSRTRATFPTHKKSHNPHPQGERGKGVNMGTLHCGGVGGVPAKPGSYIYINHIYTFYCGGGGV